MMTAVHVRMKNPLWRSALPFRKKNGKTNKDKWIEKREHKRFRLKEPAFASTSSQPEIKYQIIDMSKGGLSFWYISEGTLPSLDSLNIRLNSKITLDSVPVRTVYDSEVVKCTFIPIAIRRIGVQFGDLTDPKKDRIERFIDTYRINEELAKILH